MQACLSTLHDDSPVVSDRSRQAQHLADQIAREEARLRTLTTYTHGVRVFTWLGIALLAAAAYTYGSSNQSRLALALAAAGLIGWLPVISLHRWLPIIAIKHRLTWRALGYNSRQ